MTTLSAKSFAASGDAGRATPHAASAATSAETVSAIAPDAPASSIEAPAKPPVPIKWRQALLMGLAVYPFITVYILVLFPFTEGWAIWQRTMLLVPIMVLTIVYGIAPQLQKHLGWFITGRPMPATHKQLRVTAR